MVDTAEHAVRWVLTQPSETLTDEMQIVLIVSQIIRLDTRRIHLHDTLSCEDSLGEAPSPVTVTIRTKAYE
jgi:hypothetical protein